MKQAHSHSLSSAPINNIDDEDDGDFVSDGDDGDDDLADNNDNDNNNNLQLPVVHWQYEDDEEGFIYFFIGDVKMITTKLVVEERGVMVEWAAQPPGDDIVALAGIRKHDWEKKVTNKLGTFFIQSPHSLETNSKLIKRMDIDENGAKVKGCEEFKLLKIPVRQTNKSVF